MDKKNLLKRIKSLEKTRDKHIEKIKAYEGKNYTTPEYWEKEVKRMEDEIREDKDKLEKS